MTKRLAQPLVVCGGLSLIIAVAACAGQLPLLAGLVVGVVVLVLSAHLALKHPEVWLAVYVAVLLIMPDPHFAIAGIPIGVNGSDPLFLGALPSLILRPLRRRSTLARIALLSCLWAGLTLVSAFLFSGPSVAAASALRWIRLAEALFPVFFVLQRIKDPEAALRLCSRVFLVSGLLAAAFGIAQFFLGFDLSILGINYTSTQLLWVDGSSRRRAVGLFYESSGFGTMAALLVWVSVFLFGVRKLRYGSTRFVLLAALTAGTVALLLSFTRSAVLGLAGTLLVGLVLGGGSVARRVSLALRVGLPVTVAGIVIALFAPVWARIFVDLRLQPFLSLVRPSSWHQLVALSSGRTETWSTLLPAFWDAGPFYRLMGIGYKSLPFSTFAQQAHWTSLLSGDNQFITTLVEQGIVGLALLLILNGALLFKLWEAARNRTSFRGHWARLLAIYWTAQVLFVFPVLDYFAIFRLLPIVFTFFSLVITQQYPSAATSLPPRVAAALLPGEETRSEREYGERSASDRRRTGP